MSGFSVRAAVRKQGFRRTFFQFFLQIIAISIAVLLLTSILFYGSFERQFIGQIYAQSVDYLYYIRTVFSSLHFWMVPAFIQLASETPTANIMYRGELPLIEKVRSIDRLTSALGTYQLIHSLYVKNGLTGVYFSTVKGYEGHEPSDGDLPALLSNLKRYGTYRYIPRKIYLDQSYLTPGARSLRIPVNVLTMVIGTLPVDDSPIGGALVVNISEERLRKSYLQSNPFSTSTLLILDRDGVVMSHPDSEKSFGKDLSAEPYVRRVMTSMNPSGTFSLPVGGKRYLISWVKYRELGWHFIMLTPADEVLARIRVIRNGAVATFGLLLVVCIMLSLLISRRLAAPIQRLFSLAMHAKTDLDLPSPGTASELQYIDETFKNIVSKTGSLRERVREQEARQRTNLLKEILSGAADPSVAPELFGPFPTGAGASAWYVVVACLDDWKRLSSLLSPEESLRLREKIAAELLHRIPGAAAAVDMGTDHAAAVVPASVDAPEDGASRVIDTLAASAEAVLSTLAEEFRCSLTFGLSDAVRSVGDLHLAYDRAFTATRYRFRYGYGCCIRADGLSAPPDEYRYPEEAVRKLLAGLRLGSLGQATATLDSLFRHIEPYSFQDFRFLLKMITYNLEKLIDHPESTPSRAYIEMKRRLVEAAELETLKGAREELRAILSAYASAQEPAQVGRRAEFIGRVERLIEDNYGDPGFCVETIASRLGLSTNYLRSCFKTVTGESLSNRLQDFRLDRAIRLLLETDLTVSEIAKAAGYSNYNYFFTSFKKTTGKTPLVFRNASDRRLHASSEKAES